MDSDKEKIPPLKRRDLNPKQITVMVIRNIGKVRSFKISRRILFWSALFFMVYIGISIFIVNSYIDLRLRYKKLSKEFSSMEDTLDRKEKVLLQTEQLVTLLEDYVENSRHRTTVETTQGETEKLQIQPIEDLHEEVIETSREKKGPITASNLVNIEDIVIQKEQTGMSVDFKLVNTQPEQSAMEGYIHIFAMDKKNTSPKEWNYPNDVIKEGLPINFRRGQPFLIQRFKPYNRTFVTNSESELPSQIMVFVYDRSGTLLLKKELEVGKNVS